LRIFCGRRLDIKRRKKSDNAPKNPAKSSEKPDKAPETPAKCPKKPDSQAKVQLCESPPMATNIDSNEILRFVKRKGHCASDEILWGTFRDLERKYSIPRSSGYVLISEGLIRSKLIRHKKQRGCGRRLIDMRSVEEFLNGCPEKPTAAVRRRMLKRALASADARAAKNSDED
jgi:hypothetical protein